MSSLHLFAHGLHIQAQCTKSGVVDLVVGAEQQHQGAWGRLRQHIAHALFRAGDLCHPGHHRNALRVVASPMGRGHVEHCLAQRRAEADVREAWPIHLANGEAYYHALIVHEGVKRGHDGRPVDARYRLRREQGAEEAHRATLTPAKLPAGTKVLP